MSEHDDAKARARARDRTAKFALVLSAARQAAGNPSFRKMASRSGCISHTTLHEATQGNRFPSWETTVEFARSIGRDPSDFEQQWQAADAVVNPPEAEPDIPPPPIAKIDPGTAQHAPPTPATTTPAVAPLPTVATALGRRGTPGWLIPAVIAALVVLLVVSITALVLRSGDASSATPSTTSTAAPTSEANLVNAPGVPVSPGGAEPSQFPSPTTCPMHDTTQAIPAEQTGDHAQYGKDLTHVDCSQLKLGQRVTRKFTLKNVGSVAWHDRHVVRIDIPFTARSCTSDVSAPIPDTAPGATATVSVTITAPQHAGLCVARWMMEANGQWAFPGQKPYKAQFTVG